MSNNLIARVNAVKWFHRIEVAPGICTPGHSGPSKLEQIKMPENLAGWTVLDIGAWDGFFSFEAESRGAARVLATDWEAWTGNRVRNVCRPPRKAGFDLAKELLGSQVEEKIISIYDISPLTVGNFDLVLFLGVFYHLWHPLYALEKLYAVTDKLLIVETATDNNVSGSARMVFCLGKCHGDPSNWWYPNSECVIDMLYAVGFKQVDEVHRNSVRSAFHAWKQIGGDTYV